MSTIEINVHGSGNAIRPAERAILSLSAQSGRLSTAAEASAVVTATANAIREKIVPYCPQDEETGRTLPGEPIAHYSMSTMDTTSGRELAAEEKYTTYYTARAAFDIKFQDFGVLNKLATEFSAMQYVTISGVNWKLTDATMESIRGGARKRAAIDAVQRAWDYAEVFAGVTGGDAELKKRVRAVSVTEDHYYTQSSRPKLHYGKGERGTRTGREELQFAPEDVQLDVTVNAKFLVTV